VRVIAGDADATAVRVDPANLAFLPSWNVVGLYTYVPSSVARGPGGGGLYFASPLPLLSRIAVGASVELMRPGASFTYGDSGRLTLALAGRVLPWLSIGASYAHLFMGPLGDVDTVDVAASARFGRYAALAFVVHDLPSPQFAGFTIERAYQGELEVRPLGNYRVEIAASAIIGERTGHVAPSLRLSVSPAPGFAIRGQVEYARYVNGDSIPDNALRATVGVAIDFARAGFGTYALFGSLGDGSLTQQWQGVAATARISGDRYPSIYRPLRFERVDLDGAATSSRALPRLLDHLRRLAADDRVDGVLAVVGDPHGSWATMEELRGAIARLRAAGKHVVAYGADLSMKAYYAAAAAERVVLDPGGGLRFVGVSTRTLYFKQILDKLGVRADFVKIAEYKSAPEQFMRDGPSDEAKQVRAAVLDDIDGRVLGAIAADRKLDPHRVADLANAGPYVARAAVQAGLVDELRGGDQIEALLGKLAGRHVEVVGPVTRREARAAFTRPAIAVIHVDGDIVEGRSRNIPILDRRTAGHESLLGAIAAARADDNVRAIVLRIDSGGGNALASDLISRDVLRTRPEKPILCSLGDTAASGGYFIAAGCDTIFADPSTITGSIGIFSGKVDFSGLAEKLGVTIDLARRGAHADMDSWFRPYTDEERALILGHLRYYYDRFVAAVATGRGLKTEQVEAVARGRVFTGNQALTHKLVDRLGGFQDALALAMERGHLGAKDDFALVELPDEPTTLIGQLAALLGINLHAEDSAWPAAVRALFDAVPPSVLLGPSLPQARLPFALVD
jgi:protease-4